MPVVRTCVWLARCARRAALLLVGLLCLRWECAGMEVVAIDGKSYTDEDLTGCTKAAMEAAFLAETAELTDGEFDRLVEGMAFPGGSFGTCSGSPPQARAEARRAIAIEAFADHYSSQLAGVVRVAILRQTLARLVEAHGLVLSEYVDVGVLERASTRYTDYLRYIHEHMADEPAQAEALYDQARTRFGLAFSREDFVRNRRHRNRIADLATLRLCPQWAMRSKAFRQAHIQAAALACLIGPACEAGGFYRDEAAKVERFLEGGLRAYVVSGYTGPRLSWTISSSPVASGPRRDGTWIWRWRTYACGAR